MNPNLIDAALEQHLLSLPDAPPIAWEDVAFTPITGQAYLQVHHLRNTPTDASVTQDMRRDRGILQVTVVHPAGQGKVEAVNLADKVAALFPIGFELALDGGRLTCLQHPAIASGYPDDGWYRVPVSIGWQAFPV